MSRVIADGLIPNNRRGIGSGEIASSLSTANHSRSENGPHVSASLGNLYETGLKADGLSSAPSLPRQSESANEPREASLRPLAIDLFTGLHGWAEGLVAEGWRVIGFDIEDMCGQFGLPRPEHVQLVIQDVLTLHGAQFKDAALIVASPPCQAYSYRAMPWKRAKALPPPDNSLFEACFRIQREAIKAAGHHIPLVVENVRGAQKWVGRARWHFGSFYLWGDVPALMPMAIHFKAAGKNWNEFKGWDGRKETKPASVRPWGDGIKQAGISGPRANGKGDAWFQDGAARHGSKSTARKAASAMIAKIPLVLSRHIAAAWKPLIPCRYCGEPSNSGECLECRCTGPETGREAVS